MTPNEQYSHVSLWCLLSAPLILSGDITRLDAFTLSLCSRTTRFSTWTKTRWARGRCAWPRTGTREVWAKEMEDGSKVVGLFNRGDQETPMTVQWSDVGVRGKQAVRDLWRQKDLGPFEDLFSAPVGRHGVALIRLRAAE